MIKMDFYRFFRSKRRFLIYLFMIVAVLGYQIEMLVNTKIPEFLFPVGFDSAYGNTHIFASGIGSILSPIILFLSFGLVAGDWFLKDKKSKYAQQIRLKKGNINYVLSHYIVAFCVGAFVVMIPILVNTFVTFARVRAIPISLENFGNLISEIKTPFYRSIFLNNYPLFVVFQLLQAGLFGGLMSMFSIAVCNRSNSPYLGLFVPYFYSFVISSFFTSFFGGTDLVALTMGFPWGISIGSIIMILPIIILILYDLMKLLQQKDVLVHE